jgi:CubicO group peptidase (beta-lactamase class C family)
MTLFYLPVSSIYFSAKLKNLSVLLIAFILWGHPLLAQPKFITNRLDRYITEAMADWKVPGLAIAIVKDGKVHWLKGYGVREMGKPEKVNEHSLFMIGSVTKAFTGTSLALLEQEKKLSLDDKVQKWMPSFRMYDSLTSREATIRDMLSHRVGMKTFQGDFMYWTSDLSRQQVMEKFGKLPPVYGFRSRFGYCNAGFLTAGQIIPVVSGTSWEEYVQQHILNPLKMTRTRMLSSGLAAAENVAVPHTVYKSELIKIAHPLIDNLAPAGSMSSSVSELTHWLRMQLDSGRFEGKEIVPFQVLQKTRVGNTIVNSQKSGKSPTNFTLYGLGWFLEDYQGRLVMQHSGGVNGFVCKVAFVPEERLAMVILTNTDTNYLYEALYYQILDAYLKRPFQNYHQLFFSQYTKQEAADKAKLDADVAQVARKPKPALPLDNYTGTYTHPVYGEMEIKMEEGALTMYFSHHSRLKARLEPKEGNTFLCTFSDPVFGIHSMPFTVEGNTVKSVSVKVNDFLEYDPYEFVKKQAATQ